MQYRYAVLIDFVDGNRKRVPFGKVVPAREFYNRVRVTESIGMPVAKVTLIRQSLPAWETVEQAEVVR